MTDDSRIQIYQSPDGETLVDVRFEQEMVWLTQAYMGQVFDTTPENVLMHLKNIYKTGELEPDATATFLWLQQYDEGLLKKPGGFPGGILPTPKAAMAESKMRENASCFAFKKLDTYIQLCLHIGCYV